MSVCGEKEVYFVTLDSPATVLYPPIPVTLDVHYRPEWILRGRGNCARPSHNPTGSLPNPFPLASGIIHGPAVPFAVPAAAFPALAVSGYLKRPFNGPHIPGWTYPEATAGQDKKNGKKQEKQKSSHGVLSYCKTSLCQKFLLNFSFYSTLYIRMIKLE